MVFNASLVDIATLLGARVLSSDSAQTPINVTNITTDTRNIRSGDLFVALKGETFDGHHFVAEAAAKGAAAVVVQDPTLSPIPNLVVPDSLRAYQTLGRWWRQQMSARIIAITGSVGKTTTKELVAAALSTQAPVLKTEANFNNEIGVPKTLLQLGSHHSFGVIEMGMRGPGEIALLADIARPDVALITNVGTAHIGRLGSEQAIADAKCELLAQLQPEGIAVLNYDNVRLMETADRVWAGRVISYGLTGGDIRGRLVETDHVEVEGVRLPLPLPGQHNALNLLATVSVMNALQIDWSFLMHGLAVEMPSGRARRLTLPNDVVVLDETYNAGVESMIAALNLLAEIPGNRRIAVLGTMKELGDYSVNLHHRVGQVVKKLNLDQLWILAEPAAAEALAAGADSTESLLFKDSQELVNHLKDAVQPGDRLLFKASRSVGLDRIITSWLEP